MSKIVGRFAPSPTGLLHLGGARTALFTWLYSKSLGGDCLLRLEDTDAERSEQKYTDSIINSFKWRGIEFDQQPVYRSRNKWLGFIAKIILALAVMVGIIVFGVDHSFVWVSWVVFDRILNLMLWVLVSMLSYFSVLWLTGLRLRNITTPE